MCLSYFRPFVSYVYSIYSLTRDPNEESRVNVGANVFFIFRKDSAVLLPQLNPRELDWS